MKKILIVLVGIFSLSAFAINTTLEENDLVIVSRNARLKNSAHKPSYCNDKAIVELVAFKGADLNERLGKKTIINEKVNPTLKNLDENFSTCSSSVSFKVKDYNDAYKYLIETYGEDTYITEHYLMNSENSDFVEAGLDKAILKMEAGNQSNFYGFTYSLQRSSIFSSYGDEIYYTSAIDLKIHRNKWKLKL